MSRIFKSGLWQRYNTLLKEKPIRTKFASSFTINMVGDITCQLIMHRQEKKET